MGGAPPRASKRQRVVPRWRSEPVRVASSDAPGSDRARSLCEGHRYGRIASWLFNAAMPTQGETTPVITPRMPEGEVAAPPHAAITPPSAPGITQRVQRFTFRVCSSASQERWRPDSMYRSRAPGPTRHRGIPAQGANIQTSLMCSTSPDVRVRFFGLLHRPCGVDPEGPQPITVYLPGGRVMWKCPELPTG